MQPSSEFGQIFGLLNQTEQVCVQFKYSLVRIGTFIVQFLDMSEFRTVWQLTRSEFGIQTLTVK